MSASRAERRVVLALLGLATVLVVALHVLEPEFDPLRRFMSEYVLGPFGWLMRVTFFGLAASGALVACALRRARRWVSSLGMVLWTIGMVIAGVFVTASSLPGAPYGWSGLVHDGGADLAFLGVVVATATRSRAERLVALAMVAAVVLGRLLDMPGLGQRGFAADRDGMAAPRRASTGGGGVIRRLLGVAWEAPQTLLGVALAGSELARGRVVRIERVDGRVVIETRGTAISLGHVVMWSKQSSRWHDLDDRNRAHELGHAVQSRWLGPAYLPIVGVPSTARAIYAFAYRELTGQKWRGYYEGFPENWADQLGGVTQARGRGSP